MADDRDPLASLTAEHREELLALARQQRTPLDASFIVNAYHSLATALFELCRRQRR